VKLPTLDIELNDFSVSASPLLEVERRDKMVISGNRHASP
jgi:hypothetical protein